MRVFALTVDQVEKIRKFHPKHKKRYTGATGGGEWYKFMPTGLGDVIVYQCKCGEELDLTDVDSW